EQTDRGQRASAQGLVNVARLAYREDAGYQRADLDLLAGDQVKEALKVAPLRPADVARRVVDALELVTVVVPPWSVRPGEADVEFFVVVGIPRQVQAGLADIDDPGAVPPRPCGGLRP